MIAREVISVVPQRGQNFNCTTLPLSLDRSKVLYSPATATTSATFQRDASAKALPVLRWQRRQPHMETMVGEPVTVIRNSPHWHVAVRCNPAPSG